jgi:hypothetical protein
MFNMLNNFTETGNISPLLCKFLAGLTSICHSFLSVSGISLYLPEKMGLRPTNTGTYWPSNCLLYSPAGSNSTLDGKG